MRVTFWRDYTVPKGWTTVSWLRLTGLPCLDAPASSAQRREPDELLVAVNKNRPGTESLTRV